MSDTASIFIWWFTIFVIGALAYPITRRLFPRFADRGYAFSKIVGLVFSSYTVWLLGSVHALPFARLTIVVVLLVLLFIGLWLSIRKKDLPAQAGQEPTNDRTPWKWIVLEEILFFLALWFWSYVRATEPSINSLEKFMDFGFMNSILRTSYFPPLDMWLAKSPDYQGGQYINYYYFGHYYAAFLTKLSGLEPGVTYNLMLATLFAFTFTLSFSLAVNLWYLFMCHSDSDVHRKKNPAGHQSKRTGSFALAQDDKHVQPFGFAQGYNRHLLTIGFLAAFLVAFGGNLHTMYSFTEMYPNHDQPIPIWKLHWGPKHAEGTNTAWLPIAVANTYFSSDPKPFPIQELPLRMIGWNPDAYWYPDATRFIPNTIHEFPIYSFVVADLHGHVSDIPFVFLTLAILLAIVTSPLPLEPAPVPLTGKKMKAATGGWAMISEEFMARTHLPLISILILGVLLAVIYMTNAWDGLIYMILAGLVFVWVSFRHTPKQALSAGISGVIIASLVLAFTFLIANLPFSYNFKPFVSGVGVICPPNGIFAGLTPAPGQTEDSIAKTLGPLLFEKNHCLRSPIYMLVMLWGFFAFNALALLIFIIGPKIRQRIRQNAADMLAHPAWLTRSIDAMTHLPATDALVMVMMFVSTLLVIFPEFLYMKDIYPTHYRANTMFKLGYQAFMMLGIVSAYALFRIKTAKFTGSWRWGKIAYLILFLPLFVLVGIYPYFAIRSYYDSLRTYKGLNGMTWMKDRYPDDYQAILWLRTNVGCSNAGGGADCTNQPVIAEANGDSYTDYDRVSANTGLPTIVGWPVHEWLWRGSYDEPGRRIPEVETLYTSKDMEEVKKIIKKYNVSYIFVGQLEHDKYKELNEDNLGKLGSVVFESGGTKVYRVNPI